MKVIMKSTKTTSAFLKFCDKFKLDFDISFRYRTANRGAGRFYLHFSECYRLQVFNGIEMERFSYVNGDTPGQALKNAEKYFKGLYVNVRHLDEAGEWMHSVARI